MSRKDPLAGLMIAGTEVYQLEGSNRITDFIIITTCGRRFSIEAEQAEGGAPYLTVGEET